MYILFQILASLDGLIYLLAPSADIILRVWSFNCEFLGVLYLVDLCFGFS